MDRNPAVTKKGDYPSQFQELHKICDPKEMFAVAWIRYLANMQKEKLANSQKPTQPAQ